MLSAAGPVPEPGLGGGDGLGRGRGRGRRSRRGDDLLGLGGSRGGAELLHQEGESLDVDRRLPDGLGVLGLETLGQRLASVRERLHRGETPEGEALSSRFLGGGLGLGSLECDAHRRAGTVGVAAIHLAVAVVVPPVQAVEGLRAGGGTGALGVRAVDLAVGVVVSLVVAALLLARREGPAGQIAAIHLPIPVVVPLVVADLGLELLERDGGGRGRGRGGRLGVGLGGPDRGGREEEGEGGAGDDLAHLEHLQLSHHLRLTALGCTRREHYAPHRRVGGGGAPFAIDDQGPAYRNLIVNSEKACAHRC